MQRPGHTRLRSRAQIRYFHNALLLGAQKPWQSTNPTQWKSQVRPKRRYYRTAVHMILALILASRAGVTVGQTEKFRAVRHDLCRVDHVRVFVLPSLQASSTIGPHSTHPMMYWSSPGRRKGPRNGRPRRRGSLCIVDKPAALPRTPRVQAKHALANRAAVLGKFDRLAESRYCIFGLFASYYDPWQIAASGVGLLRGLMCRCVTACKMLRSGNSR